ncbi:MAG: hypothetical protein KME07_21640 [Pegethrix bostrychoides GSE-TBD4-15B]|jgi:hypothetical protein|uniref:Uncharacterized protein n=1 Tax=Pegethrix bostrychoides GSE-TBD4-15B TaxID=2839662 RepID=A0A951PE56_9CYAN|nr:hypothetical protein [Pegethrix bostrychoides GSE-TBD4-15B]
MAQIKIRKTILSDSLKLEGLSQFLGQEVEIWISQVSNQPQPKPSFMRFAGIATAEASLLEALEADSLANRSLDMQRDW